MNKRERTLKVIARIKEKLAEQGGLVNKLAESISKGEDSVEDISKIINTVVDDIAKEEIPTVNFINGLADEDKYQSSKMDILKEMLREGPTIIHFNAMDEEVRIVDYMRCDSQARICLENDNGVDINEEGIVGNINISSVLIDVKIPAKSIWGFSKAYGAFNDMIMFFRSVPDEVKEHLYNLGKKVKDQDLSS